MELQDGAEIFITGTIKYVISYICRHHFKLWAFESFYGWNMNQWIKNNGFDNYSLPFWLFLRTSFSIQQEFFCLRTKYIVSHTARPHWVDVQNVLVSIQTSQMVCVFRLFNGTALGLWRVIMGTPVCEICYAKEAGEWCSKGPPFGTKSRESAIKRSLK